MEKGMAASALPAYTHACTTLHHPSSQHSGRGGIVARRRYTSHPPNRLLLLFFVVVRINIKTTESGTQKGKRKKLGTSRKPIFGVGGGVCYYIYTKQSSSDYRTRKAI